MKSITFIVVNLHTIEYCKPINIGGYLIWHFFPSGHIDCHLNWLSLVVSSMNLYEPLCIGGYLIWRVLGPTHIHQLQSPPNIVLQYTRGHFH